MRKLTVLAATIALALAASMAALAQTQPAPAVEHPLAGEWDAVAYYDTDVAFSLVLEVEGATVTGTITTPEGTTDLRNGKWEAGVFSFESTYQGTPVAMSATLAEGRLVGTWTYGGGEASGRWQATRKAPK
jgi:hypothetical protein